MRAIIFSILLSLSFVNGAAAQTPRPAAADTAKPAKPAGDPNWPTRVFQIKYVDIQNLSNLLSPFITDGMSSRTESNMGAISVRGPAATLTAIEEVIKRFDIPANSIKNVEFMAYILQASEGSESESFPATLRPVVDQLKSIMAYKSYSLLETVTGRGDGRNNITLVGSIPIEGVTSIYSFKVFRIHVSGEGADQTIHFETLDFQMQNPSMMQILTSLDVKKGQQVVVGKTGLKDRAIILVMTAKVVD